jgi:hypothetical protein
MSTLAERFVDLILKYGNDLESLTEFPPEEMQLFFDVVSVAGFDVKEPVHGVLEGNWCDEEGNETGKKFIVNQLIPIKFFKTDGKKYNYIATGWLDEVARHVLRMKGSIITKEGFVDFVDEEIKKNIPLKPILVTSEGDCLIERVHRNDSEYTTFHAKEDSDIRSFAIYHQFCGGYIERHKISETHECFSCRGCNLRVTFPKEIITVAELRAYFLEKLRFTVS